MVESRVRYPDGAREVDAVENGAAEVRPAHGGVLEGDAEQVGLDEARARQVRFVLRLDQKEKGRARRGRRAEQGPSFDAVRLVSVV